MRDLLKLAVFAVALVAFLSSGLIAGSAEKKCPATPPDQHQITEYEFLKAHGLTQQSFSIWLNEHSEWRRKYKKDLEQFSFIPEEDYDTQRRGE